MLQRRERRVSARSAAAAGGRASRDGAAGRTRAAGRRVPGPAAPRLPRSAGRPAPSRRRTGLVAPTSSSISPAATLPNTASSRSIAISSSSPRSGTTRTFVDERSASTALPQVGSTGIVDSAWRQWQHFNARADPQQRTVELVISESSAPGPQNLAQLTSRPRDAAVPQRSPRYPRPAPSIQLSLQTD